MRIRRHFGEVKDLFDFSILDFYFLFFFGKCIFVTDRDAERSEPLRTKGIGWALLLNTRPLPPLRCPFFYNSTRRPPLSLRPALPSYPLLLLNSSSIMFSTPNPSPTPTPRPILKRNCSSLDRERKQAVVHFPPSPIISKTFVAHSPSTYDRSPIVVVPNTCALPERGCPGRTYTLDRNGHRRNEFGGLRILFNEDPAERRLPPPLIQDTSSSSSSDESCDGLAPLPSHIPDSKHRKRGVRRQHKLSSTPSDHCTRSSFTDCTMKNDLADEGIFGGF